MSDVAYGAELRVAGDLVYLRPVRSFIRELAKNTGFSHERVSDIELAVDEIFSNAIEHGSAGSMSQIVIYCLLTEASLRITFWKNPDVSFVAHFSTVFVAVPVRP